MYMLTYKVGITEKQVAKNDTKRAKNQRHAQVTGVLEKWYG